MKLKFEIELLSDVLLSSGDSENSTIDTDSIYDEWGLPWLPSKRLKGILKEVAEDQVLCNLLNQEALDELFGKNDPTKETYGSLQIGNGYIANASKIKDGLNSYLRKYNLENKVQMNKTQFRTILINQLTQTRAMIKINENGVAEDSSLRFVRAVNKDQIKGFECVLECPEIYKEVMINLLKGLRRLGSHRTRGFGSVRVKNIKEIHTHVRSFDPDSRHSNEDDLFELIYQIKALEPLVLTSLDGQYGMTESYITGTQIRGALTRLFLKDGNLRFQDAFLKDEETIFSPAYPSSKEEVPFVPSPLCYRIEKYGSNQVRDLRAGKEVGLIEEGVIFKNMKPWYDGSRDLEIESLIMSHHARPQDRSKGTPYTGKDQKPQGELYTLAAIPEGRCFYGKIQGKKYFLEKIQESMQTFGKLSVGKSLNSQYGNVELVRIKLKPKTQKIDQSIHGNLDLILETPMMIMNDYGAVGPFIPYLKSRIESEFKQIRLVDTFLAMKVIGGFNAKWQTPVSKVTAIDKGSVFCFEILVENGSISSEEVITFIQKEICTRSNEGYNQMRVLKDIHTYHEEITLDFKMEDVPILSKQADLALDENQEGDHDVEAYICMIEQSLKQVEIDQKAEKMAKSIAPNLIGLGRVIRELYGIFLMQDRGISTNIDDQVIVAVDNIKSSTESQSQKQDKLAGFIEKYTTETELQFEFRKALFEYLIMHLKKLEKEA